MTCVKRRDFLATLGAGLVVPFGSSLQPKSASRKNWAWMRGEIKDLDGWRRLLASLKKTGFDAILISGDAGFYRKYVPIAAQEGLELHAWMFTMMRGENVKAHPEWYAVSRRGESTAVKPPYVDYYKFMCPSRDEVREHLRGVVREIASVDGLASVHLDYIRYPDVILPVALWSKYKLVQDREHPEFDYCYCDVCRESFRRQAGVDPQALADPPAHQAWLQYRYDTITKVVAELFDVSHRYGKPLTAAVFPTPSIARALVRQDWTQWKLDAVLPMVYNGFYKEDVPWIERATREGVLALGGRMPLYSGLYVPDLPPADLARAVSRALAGGADGISVFEGHMLTADYLKALGPILKTPR
jgi:hypothetical protein